MQDRFTWDRLGRFAVALGACALIGGIAFNGATQVPVLGLFDYVSHQVAHLATTWAPPLVSLLAGPVAQVAVPLGLALYFGLRRRDPVAAAVTLAWAGTAANSVSVHIADAPFRRLPVPFPSTQHDWAYILGPHGFGTLDNAAVFALAVEIAGRALVGGAILILLVLAVQAQLGLEASPGEIRKNLTLPFRRRRAPAAVPLPAHPIPGGPT